jgi:hypothetical protein
MHGQVRLQSGARLCLPDSYGYRSRQNKEWNLIND